MVRFGCAITLLLLAACDDAPPAASLKEIPAQFVGNWEVSPGDCGAGGPDGVVITPTEIVFANSKIAVKGVAPDGDVAARVDGTFTTAEATWDGAVRLELGEGGRVLNVVNGATLTPRVKCS
jgi:hypothetical protein